MEFIQIYWPVFVAGLIIGLIVCYFIFFRQKQSVRLSDSVPLRPHMATPAASPGDKKSAHPFAEADEFTDHIVKTNAHPDIPPASGPADDLVRLKGVGPKLVAILHERGITRFEQIAKLSSGQVEALDASLGAFRGRFDRDRIVEQADYLARGDIDGFEAKFGKL